MRKRNFQLLYTSLQFCALSILFSLGTSSIASAQGWIKVLPNDTLLREASSIVTTNDGGFAMLDIGIQSIIKTDPEGNELWQQPLTLLSWGSIAHNLLLTNDGGFGIAYTYSIGPVSQSALEIRGPNGAILWQSMLPESFANYITSLTQDDQNNFYLSGSDPFSVGFIAKLDPLGNLLWKTSIPVSDFIRDITISTTGDIIACGRSSINNPPIQTLHAKIDANTGDLVWFNLGENYPLGATRIEATTDGGAVIIEDSLTRIDMDGNIMWRKYQPGRNLVVTASDEIALVHDVIGGDGHGVGLTRLDGDGNLIQTDQFALLPGIFNQGNDLTENQDGGYTIGGMAENWIPTGPSILLIKTGPNGLVYSNRVEGNVFHDENDDCQNNGNELGLNQWFVAFEGTQNFYAVSDAAGNYSLQIDTGLYTPSTYPPNNLWATCPSSDLNVNGSNNIYNKDFPIQSIIDCPGMDVDIATTFLRICNQNYYVVSWCNNGTLPAEDASIEVTLDSFIILDSASIAYTDLGNNVFSFPLGTADLFECGRFYLYTRVSCEATLGQTHCVTAYAYPDDLCQLPPLWSGASIGLFGSCINDDSIHFEIKNIGAGTMSNQLNYIVIEDDMILRDEPFNPLPPAGTFSFTIPADGSMYRLESEQEANHPGESMPAIFVEGCNGFEGLGFASWYADDDENPFVSVLCLENIGSFDPNDKMGFPRGYGDQHYIEANTELEYQVRFQNTGTDTAFYVQIRDTLSPWLDVTTIRPGASSHPYTWEIVNTDVGAVLKFTFEDIELPHEDINEPMSHGFVHYKIDQQVDNPIGTIIENSAAIYFDFNEPVITETVFHTIGEDFIDILNFTPELSYNDINIKVYPNPTFDKAHFVLNKNPLNHTLLKIYSNNGTLVKQLPIEGKQVILERGQLAVGLYRFIIEADGLQVGKGSLVIQ